ncbi:MAG TPA: protease inhibitor I42 family protein [Methanothrix sp.]|jgi:inhibitor of cysteine peptidase|uniref:protease inhibitor I42 family protein n=1 Tax=Methanothrix sp. TaxID=90426 RepID=UPI002C21B5FB|nr:protease inhibitor I42 family protein [Methanothrix sp.]MDI9418469.1 protease inhibitor I42 family protein [Euryarchaeota archaeon]HON36662.1 protease inhibitor I42 family protein [Methanothrix sp.]HRU76306.1 protease inhibitor I42 family protein [Methanothrix sp.]
MNVRLNEDFMLSLESNPTTGYVWEAIFDSAFLDLKKKDFKASDEKSVGAAGMEIFTFLPIKAGKTEITMVRKRAWESSPLEERSIPVEIAK